MSTNVSFSIILGLAPCASGFGFAVLETRGRLTSWGIARVHSDNDEELVRCLDSLIERYDVEILALEDVVGSSRSERVLHRLRVSVAYAKERYLSCRLTSRQGVRGQCGLPEGATKLAIAETLIRLLPELTMYLPARRKPWEREADSMKLFEAAGLAFAASGISIL